GTARPRTIAGVLAIGDADGNRKGYDVTADVAVIAAPNHITLWLAMAFAFVGGLILNVMPCVLPVLAMKVLAVTSRHLPPAQVRGEALLYATGVMTAFLLLA